MLMMRMPSAVSAITTFGAEVGKAKSISVAIVVSVSPQVCFISPDGVMSTVAPPVGAVSAPMMMGVSDVKSHVAEVIGDATGVAAGVAGGAAAGCEAVP